MFDNHDVTVSDRHDKENCIIRGTHTVTHMTGALRATATVMQQSYS